MLGVFREGRGLKAAGLLVLLAYMWYFAEIERRKTSSMTADSLRRRHVLRDPRVPYRSDASKAASSFMWVGLSIILTCAALHGLFLALAGLATLTDQFSGVASMVEELVFI